MFTHLKNFWSIERESEWPHDLFPLNIVQHSGDFFKKVSVAGGSLKRFPLLIKGTVARDFRPSVFFLQSFGIVFAEKIDNIFF
jgi:hypothetical protein